MRRMLAVTILAGLWLLLSPPVRAHDHAPEEQAESSHRPPGEHIARAVTVTTGVGLEPLFTASAYGALKYSLATGEQRRSLPWYAQPWFWIPALLVIGLRVVKDAVGIVLPRLLKKPLDLLETVEHNVSGLVATGAFVPLIAPVAQDFGVSQATFTSMGVASPHVSWLLGIALVPILIGACLVVFLLSGAINVLILLSPFRLVDVALKAVRLFLLTTVAATAWANPWLGAAWALVIILVAWRLAGWSFRLSCLGLAIIWDVLTRRHRRFAVTPHGTGVFLSRALENVPARTYGTLACADSHTWTFSYRPWLFLPRQTLHLAAGQYEVGRGAFYSEILRVEGEDVRTVMLLPPRYRGHEERLVGVYRFGGIRDVGLRAVLKWLKDSVGSNSRRVVAHP